ncbi:hypothetical protein L211DRAFT_849802 [Terfezia boudieri ATCC MYA-4762]|uniref:Uncharacterized protein n=1 Tax=Terfezia boudieri ATCC MYA-4762 TaxID=1051890 RepID=A0A3N4LPF9_9PEZI|nr:hypothetical protein L211DRAFT_849802 [Terfezia boudieri ATCC MYA-4762]
MSLSSIVVCMPPRQQGSNAQDGDEPTIRNVAENVGFFDNGIPPQLYTLWRSQESNTERARITAHGVQGPGPAAPAIAPAAQGPALAPAPALAVAAPAPAVPIPPRMQQVAIIVPPSSLPAGGGGVADGLLAGHSYRLAVLYGWPTSTGGPPTSGYRLWWVVVYGNNRVGDSENPRPYDGQADYFGGNMLDLQVELQEQSLGGEELYADGEELYADGEELYADREEL